MEQSSWEADSPSDCEEVPLLLWNPNVRYRVHKSSPLDPILHQPNPVYDLTSCLFNILSNTVLSSTPGDETNVYFVFSMLIPSPVSIETRLWAGRPGFGFRQGHWWDFFSSPQRPDRIWGSPSLLSYAYRGLLSRGCSVGVKNVWSYISTAQYVFTAWCVTK